MEHVPKCSGVSLTISLDLQSLPDWPAAVDMWAAVKGSSAVVRVTSGMSLGYITGWQLSCWRQLEQVPASLSQCSCRLGNNRRPPYICAFIPGAGSGL